MTRETAHGGRRNLTPLIALVAAALMLCLGLAGTAQAGEHDPVVLTPDSTPFGKTYGEWAAAWWQHVLAIPPSANPLLDATGANCENGSHGRVFFLAGSFQGDTARHCTIPKNKSIFFPIANVECSNVEPFPFFGATPADRATCAKGFLDQLDPATVGVTLKTSGEMQEVPIFRKLPSFRTTSPDFRIMLPEQNILGASERQGRAADAGFYLMLAPLASGHHTLHFSAGEPFYQSMTYTLVVEGQR